MRTELFMLGKKQTAHFLVLAWLCSDLQAIDHAGVLTDLVNLWITLNRMEIATLLMNAVIQLAVATVVICLLLKHGKTLTMLCNKLCCCSDEIAEGGLSSLFFCISLLNTLKKMVLKNS